MTEYTKKIKQKRNVFLIFDIMVWTVLPLIMAILAMSHLGGGTDVLSIFSAPVRDILIGFGLTTIIGLVSAILIKDKIRTFLFMASLVIAVALYHATGMYIVLGLWFLDEYILHALYKYYANKYTINKEIDKRG